MTAGSFELIPVLGRNEVKQGLGLSHVREFLFDRNRGGNRLPYLTQVLTERLKLVCRVEEVERICRDLDGPSGLFGRVSSSTFQRPAGSLKVEVLGLHRYLSSTMERTKPRGCRA